MRHIVAELNHYRFAVAQIAKTMTEERHAASTKHIAVMKIISNMPAKLEMAVFTTELDYLVFKRTARPHALSGEK